MELSFSSRTFKLWYYRYKDSPFYALSILVGTILLSAVLSWKLVYPQVTNWFSINNEIVQTQKRITSISNNITYLSSLSDATLSDSLTISTQALPMEKDFVGILLAISQAARITNVSLDDYAVTFGDLAANSPDAKNLANVRLKLIIGNGVNGAKRFIKEIQESVPLAEVISITSSNNSTVTLQFYYKPLGSLKASDTAVLPRISPQQQELLETLQTWWEKTQQTEEIPTPEDVTLLEDQDGS